MMFSRIIAFIFLLCILAISAHAENLRVALLLEHDGSSPWNELLKGAMTKASQKFGILPEIILAEPPENQSEIFRKAAQEHDVVLVASDSLHEILRDNAANFRRVKFGAIDAGIRAPNIMSVTFADEQAAFLAGAAAAMLAGANSGVGWLSGMDTPAMRSLFNGFSEGVGLEGKNVRVIQAVTGSFTDPQAAARKTEWLIANGASVIILASGAGNREAMLVAEKAHIPVILLDKAVNRAVISKAADRAVLEIIGSAISKFRGKEIVTYDLENGGVAFLGIEHLAGADKSLLQNIKRRLDELEREIIGGNIRLRSLRQRTLCDCLD